jgi:hypothetical protein
LQTNQPVTRGAHGKLAFALNPACTRDILATRHVRQATEKCEVIKEMKTHAYADNEEKGGWVNWWYMSCALVRE